MKDITILLPIHEYDEELKDYIQRSIKSVEDNRKTYNYGKLILKIVCPDAIKDSIVNVAKEVTEDYEFVINKGQTDFCSQINLGVDYTDTDYFSILEYDDHYAPTWFKTAHEYYYTHEDVSVFLPINNQYNTGKNVWQYCNELVWANSFSSELGFVDFECLEDCPTFNLTGGIFCTSDFKIVGGFKSSIKIAFNYELLLRLTNKKLKVYVVPKEGYHHMLSRDNSLTDEYLKTISVEEVQKWFELAKREYTHTEDRQKTITSIEEELK